MSFTVQEARAAFLIVGFDLTPLHVGGPNSQQDCLPKQRWRPARVGVARNLNVFRSMS